MKAMVRCCGVNLLIAPRRNGLPRIHVVRGKGFFSTPPTRRRNGARVDGVVNFTRLELAVLPRLLTRADSPEEKLVV